MTHSEGTLQDTAAILHHFNETSSVTYATVAAVMERSAKQVQDIQKDFLHIFHALRLELADTGK